MKYTITLEYNGKQYSFLDSCDYQAWDEYRNADYVVTYMYTEGNFSCDCNRSDFLLEHCYVSFKDNPEAETDERYENEEWTLPCGDTIKLISIAEGGRVIWPEPVETQPVLYIQQTSGLYIPSRG